MQAFKGVDKGKNVVHRRNLSWVKEGRGEQPIADSSGMVTKKGSTGRLYPQVTIDVLPDNVLLDTFEFYLGKDPADEFDYFHKYDGWQTLVHVCRRWRSIMFASPRRLDLKLYCTRRRPVNSKTVDSWPALPIVIVAEDMESREDATNIIDALKHHNRVCKIFYHSTKFQDLLLEEFAAIDEPFPVLTSLVLQVAPLSKKQHDVPVLPDSFLGGSAPRLLSLQLNGIPYPSIGRLLSSTTNLVQLILWRIPHSGYIAPETIVPCLSTLVRLKLLNLGFRYPRRRSQDDRANRRPPPLTRVVFPSLTSLNFHGDIEYLEDILSQFETPMLEQSKFNLFNQLAFDTPLLGHFIRRTETFMTSHAAHVECTDSGISIILLEREERDEDDRQILELEVSCEPFDWQLSSLAQLLNSFLSSFSTLESLKITVHDFNWQDEIEAIQWRELFHPFTAVKKLTVESENLVQLVAPALQELAGETATEVLPALQNLFLSTGDWQPSGPVKEAIEQFIAARQLAVTL